MQVDSCQQLSNYQYICTIYTQKSRERWLFVSIVFRIVVSLWETIADELSTKAFVVRVRISEKRLRLEIVRNPRHSIYRNDLTFRPAGVVRSAIAISDRSGDPRRVVDVTRPRCQRPTSFGMH